MSEPAVIEGRYVDVRPIRTRKVLQITVEVPLELASEVTTKLGWPDPVNGSRCAVALLNDGAKLAGGSANGGPASVSRASEAPPAKPKRKWDELAPSAQAGIRCGEHAFWAYLNERHGDPRAVDTETADECLKNWFGITSKTELNIPGPDLDAWRRIDADYSKARR